MQALNVAINNRDSKNFDAARFICLQLLGHEFVSVDASIIMLEMSVDLRRPADTHEFCERLQQAAIKQTHAAVALAKGLRTLNKHDAALRAIKKALKTRPSSCALKYMRAGYLIEANEKEQAASELRSIVRIDRNFMPAYQHLAAIGALTPEEISWLEDVELMGEDRITAFTALATAFRKQGDVDKEFHFLDLAQAEISDRTNWDPENFSVEAQATINVFDTAYFNTDNLKTQNIRRPIFIMGMPRSGSTLTEQILETNEDVEAIGESTLLHCTIQDFCRKKFGSRPFLEVARDFEPDDFTEIADSYLNQVEKIYTRVPIFIDKQLNSYMYLGFLSKAYPNAKFIHTLRNPLDNCLSCYQQVFEQMEASRSLESLAMMYKDHLKLMDHWKKVLGNRIFTARYEDMIADPRRQAQALLEFCDIPWNENALNFHANKSAVKTASMMQVRQPIYTTSVEKWRHYESHLEPVMRVLGLEPNCEGADD